MKLCWLAICDTNVIIIFDLPCPGQNNQKLIMIWASEEKNVFVFAFTRVSVCAVSITERGPWSQRFCPFSGQEGGLIEDFKGITACLQTTHFWTLSIQVIILSNSVREEEKGTYAHPADIQLRADLEGSLGRRECEERLSVRPKSLPFNGNQIIILL